MRFRLEVCSGAAPALIHRVKSATTEVNFGGWISSYVISDRKWKSLPADVQGAMTTLADKYNREGCEKVMADDLREVVAALKIAGVCEDPFG